MGLCVVSTMIYKERNKGRGDDTWAYEHDAPMCDRMGQVGHKNKKS